MRSDPRTAAGGATLAEHPDLPVPVLLRAHPRARRIRIRLDERALMLKVTHPRRVRPSAALAWAASQKQWVVEQIGKLLPAEPLLPGAVIPVEGQDVELVWLADRPRLPTLADGKLVCGGPLHFYPRRIEQFLKRMALATLSAETAQVAGASGVRVAAVSVGDARTRWGSCSSNRRIRYCWRLILAPPEARRFVVAHEVAHLEHFDHGPLFKALEQRLFGGDTAAAKALLQELGPRLRRIGLPG